jgi:hypothetical protein
MDVILEGDRVLKKNYSSSFLTAQKIVVYYDQRKFQVPSAGN